MYQPRQSPYRPAPVDDFRSAMRCLSGGVTIVTASDGAARYGITATAVCSLSVDPPSLLVCVNRCSAIHPIMSAHRTFCVNVVPSWHTALVDHFAGRSGCPIEDRFKTADWTTLVTGSPVLTDAASALDCALTEAIDCASHTIFIGMVVAASSNPAFGGLVHRHGDFHPVLGSGLPAPVIHPSIQVPMQPVGIRS